MSPGKRVWVWVAFLIGLYLAICAVAWALQKKLVYFPGPAPTTSPKELGLEHQDVALRTRDGLKLAAWYLPARAPRLAVLYCNGNAGSMQDRIGKAEAWLGFGASVLLFDYRGYGASEGAPDEQGTYRDAEAAFDALAEFAPTLKIVVHGESLGGAIAVELARHREVAALVLDGTFTSLPDVGARAYPWLPVRWLASLRYDSLSKVPALELPILIAHSRTDEIVPFALAEALHRAAREPKTLVETHGDHNAGGILLDPSCEPALAEFLADVVAARR